MGPLIGIVVGGVIGGLAQWITARRSSKEALIHDALVTRRSEYFVALDVMDRTRGALSKFARNNSGRTQPADSDNSPEAKEMRERDRKSAKALRQIIAASRALTRENDRIGAVGSPAVRIAMTQLDEQVSEYLRSQFATNRFQGQLADQFRPRFESLADAVVTSIRADLQVDRIYDLASGRRWKTGRAPHEPGRLRAESQ